MITFDHPADMRNWSDDAHRQGKRVGLVPTMGYLHQGHLSLVEIARRRADLTVASIFVNPMQFGPAEDLERYPRDEAGDRAKLEAAGVDALYMPTGANMYGPGYQTTISVAEVTSGLCGEARPIHFQGVSTVVAKLFNAVRPDVAVFGEKDYQQLATIRRMVRDLDWGIEIVGGPIVREPDGLAMSSRNVYLSPAEREAALALSRSLEQARCACRSGEVDSDVIVERVRSVVATEPLVQLEYAAVVDAESMQPVDRVGANTLLALAAQVGTTRLIDNTLLAAA